MAIDKGYVYLLTNPVMPGIVKIGMTRREELDDRLSELYTTGVPLPFECVCACKVPQDRCLELEQALHTAFAPYRVNPNREFFRINPEQAMAIMKFFNAEDATEEVKAELENDLTPTDIAAGAAARSRTKRPSLNFLEMGMSVGDVITWKADPNITATIVSEKKVKYEGEIYSLSPLSTMLSGAKWGVAPCGYWMYGEKTLTDIYDETYPMED